MLTDEQIIRALDEAVAEKGEDYEYDGSNGCMYGSPDGEASCIVGHVIAKLAPITFESVVRWDWANQARGEDTAVDDLNKMFYLFDERQELALRKAQNAQDRGIPWGDARDMAKKILEKKQ